MGRTAAGEVEVYGIPFLASFDDLTVQSMPGCVQPCEAVCPDTWVRVTGTA